MLLRKLVFPLLFISIGLWQCGCAETYLLGPPLGNGYVRLAAAANRPRVIATTQSSDEETIGHQWVLIFIPAGKIRVKDPAQLGTIALYRALAMRGYRPIVQTADSLLDASITITKVDLSCSVPDFFFFRSVRCQATMNATVAGNTGSVGGHGEASEFKVYGFGPQLEVELAKALDDAVNDLLTRVRL